MHNPDTTGSAIRFTRPWVTSDREGDILEELKKDHVEKLPSSSQWHRFRQKVLGAGDLQDIRRFLSERPEKASSRTKWCFKFRKSPFNEYLIKAFVAGPECARSIREILGYRYFGLAIGPLPGEISGLRLPVVKQALLRFIDQVILLKEGITFRVSLDGPEGKVEVDL